jgi:hypothetical protein
MVCCIKEKRKKVENYPILYYNIKGEECQEKNEAELK